MIMLKMLFIYHHHHKFLQVHIQLLILVYLQLKQIQFRVIILKDFLGCNSKVILWLRLVGFRRDSDLVWKIWHEQGIKTTENIVSFIYLINY